MKTYEEVMDSMKYEEVKKLWNYQLGRSNK